MWVSKVIEHARLTSEITTWMSALRNKKPRLKDAIPQLQRLEHQLTCWLESLPVSLRPGSSLKRSAGARAGLHYAQIIYLHYAYHGTIIALNSCFTWPWLSSSLISGDDSVLEVQIKRSIPLVAEAARSIIKLTHYIEIDCSTPVW